MSDTPETDMNLFSPRQFADDAQVCTAGHARHLERRLTAARLENERLAKDAARYRWFREAVNDHECQGSQLIRMGVGAFTYEIPAELELDAAIDAVLQQGGQGEGT